MGCLTRYTITLLVTLSCAAFCQLAYSQTKTAKKPTASVSGRVTVKGKGKGGIVVGARVGDFGPQMSPLFKATTDPQGNYHITDLPSGNYQIAPVAPAFIGPDAQRGKTLIMSDGENVDGIDFSLVRGGVITGKVSQQDGRPVIEERITISVADQPDRRGSQTQVNTSFQTDDRGIYRVFGLPAGHYKVSIGLSGENFLPVTRPGRPAYERVFYPDATNPNEAKVVELGEGAEATNIDITVGQPASGFSVTGLVVDGESNKPLATLSFGLQRVVGERDSNFMGTTTVSDRIGEFRFENLTPGKYSVFLMPQPNVDLRADPVAFEVVDQDLTGIMVRTDQGASVSGTVVLEGSHDKSIQSKMAQLRVYTFIRSETPATGFGQTSSIARDGGFRIGGLQAGVAQFQLGAQERGVEKGFVISRVERDGVVVPRGVEVKSGEQISGIRLVLVYASGIIRGSIKVENGPLPTGARFMIRLVKPEDPSFMVRPGEVDARGRFTIEGVPAGSYELTVQSFLPGARSRAPSTKQLVTVSEGAVTEVEALIDLEGNSPPTP